MVLMVDPTKKWTFEYASREIDKIPDHIYVLLLVNYRDMGDHRVVCKEEAERWYSTVLI